MSTDSPVWRERPIGRLVTATVLIVALVGLAAMAVSGGILGDVGAGDGQDAVLASDDGPEPTAVDIVTKERTVESTELAPGQTTTVEVFIETESDLGSGELLEVEDQFSPAFQSVELQDIDPGGSAGAGPNNEELLAIWNTDNVTYTLTYDVTVPSDAADGDTFDITGTLVNGGQEESLPSATITVSNDLKGVELQPSDTTVRTEEQAVFDVVATGADSGVGSYSLDVSSSESTVGELANVSVAGQPAMDNSSISVDGSSALIEADMGDNDFAAADEIVIAELTVDAGGVDGETDLTFDDASVSDGSGSAYNLDYTGDATLTVADLDPAFFEISEFSIPGEVEVDSNFDVSATLTNTGEVSETKEISLLIDDSAEQTQSVTLDAGATESVTFSDITLDTLGDFEVAIETGDQNVSRSVSVQEDLGPPAVVGNTAPQDLNGDGLFRDVDGNGEFNIFDVQTFFSNFGSDVVQNNGQYFNFDGDANDEVGIFDVQALFTDLQAQ